MTAEGLLVDQLGGVIALQRLDRILPVTGDSLIGQHRMARPGQAGHEPGGLAGVVTRCNRFPKPFSLDVEPVQTDGPELRVLEHGLETCPRLVVASGKLRALGQHKVGGRLAGEQFSGFLSVAARRHRIAHAQRDHGARQRVITPIPPPAPEKPAKQPWRPKDEEKQVPQRNADRHQHGERDHGGHQPDLDAIALPIQRHQPRTIGNPGRPERRDEQHGNEDQEANHAVLLPLRALTWPPLPRAFQARCPRVSRQWCFQAISARRV